MITLVALSFSDDLPSLDSRRTVFVTDTLSMALRRLREASALDAGEEIRDELFNPPPFRSDVRPPFSSRDSRRFRFDDDPDERRN